MYKETGVNIMKKYIVEISELAEQDFEKIIRIGHAFMDWEKYLKDE